MPEQSWSNQNADEELDPIGSLLSEWSDPEEDEDEFRSDYFRGQEGRRGKAALALITIWGTVIALHLVPWGLGLVMSFTGILLVHGLRLIATQPQPNPEPLAEDALATAPKVSLLIAAKNEEAVIGRLVRMLCNLDYPRDRYEVWAIDDDSSDRTPEILDRLAAEYPQLKVLHRPAGAGGGKSGALNQIIPLITGSIIGVFDADATVTPDMLRRIVTLFDNEKIGAVQMRKAIANDSYNFWTQGQKAEMALDCYFQQQRIAVGGIGELRGNGQFVRREALMSCGGWNEETITDDLDLTIRLHLDRWDIGFCLLPAVNEEGVTGPKALWHQRNRWAEGGYQRYLDYWRLIASNRLDFTKTLDLIAFVLIQYILPTAAIPDLFMVLWRHDLPVLSPLSALMISWAVVAMSVGLYRTQPKDKNLLARLGEIIVQTARGMIYMMHWMVIMPATTGRMSVRPKRLKWVKTVHQGSHEESAEASL
ncbi:glycosyltransferase family 2 protein [Oscillatoria sp. FACHB-1406]|uniref:glycosyltransferase n=1 Tax=Oscillatoria sp. FACHB-1406 TaxID=2692846 RepID=UPI001682AF11|nr:glycosyltransferase family 2 protein [Oscillatoria sp. FACHB-1406]MBD2577471.1 glycosyltransferase family 2 protein [Oscillatoria sp. FACHB-1406]